MSTTSGNGSGTSTSGGSTIIGVGGALSLMGCVREASPSPQEHHHTLDMGDFAMHRNQRNVDTLPKELKKRRFHPLRGLRRIFRRKSRSAADAKVDSRGSDRTSELVIHDREEMTLRHPAGRPDDARSQSASELLTDSCDRQSKRVIGWPKKYRISMRKSFNHVFLRRSRGEEPFGKLRGTSGQLSVSHDSVFPGEVPHTRPLSSLDTLATLQRRQSKTSDEAVHKNCNPQGPYNHRMSNRVLEQIKTAIENRNQLASAGSTYSSHASREHYQQDTTENRFTRLERREKIDEGEKFRVTRTLQQDENERINKVPKEELPELEIASLNHTAAHHRISVRPKNRRPPRRTATNTSMSCSTITTISEGSDVLDSLEPISTSNESTPIDTKSISILRKSSSRLSRNSDIFEELEAKLPKKPSSLASLSPDSLDIGSTRGTLDHTDTDDSRESKSITRKSSNRIPKPSNLYDELELKIPKKRSSTSRLSKSPDSLDNSFSKSTEGFDKLIEDEKVPTFGRLQNLMSKSSDGFDKLSEQMEVKPMPRRFSNVISKSTDAFDTLTERDEPRPVARRLLHPVSKFPNVSKSSDSLEAIQTLESDDSIERRRSSFEIRPRRSLKVMSMSSENFEALEKPLELHKLSSASDVHLSRMKHQSKMNNNIISKSSENFESMANSIQAAETHRSNDFTKPSWKSYKRTVSSESSDNLELDDKIENRRVRKPPKRVPSSSIVDVFQRDSYHEDERRPVLMRKPPRLQKSSESSELGSTDTIDSEKRNKSSDSTETLDSLEKDLEQDTRDEDMSSSFGERHDKHDSWSSKPMDMKHDRETADGVENSRPLSFTDNKSYWRQSSDSKENIDIHQLLSIVSRMTDNGNNNQRNSVPFPNKLTSPPSSPVVKQEDNKLLFNNLLTTKNNEELQNMLNGNISEVSTDTKSFKEKLIMFEKLGK
ncbi:dentin sialophosphoprotein-like isoform X2 [Chelonus insularis]|uniref:dentin sialophosphoprotein-like isoform X2 n=1 Tax=Chelonus insularis TaxID=460826 RepID=UPI00158DBB73|nr:dentin sialophosphoprotein-like isoform X2 [Chelonus insularis]